MSGRITREAPRRHHCNPGWRDEPGPAPWDPGTQITFAKRVDHGVTAGSIWSCDCGRTHVAYYCQQIGCLMPHWRPEGRLARWWRQRRECKEAR